MRIIELRAENIKRIKAVDIRPGKGAVVTVGGRNAQGKTSVLDAIAMAIGGEKLVPDKPVRSGAQKAFAEVDLGDYKVRRSFTAAGGTTLTVTAADGSKVKSPQALLDTLAGRLSFDPLAFMRLRPAEQQETLRRMVNLDTTEIDALRARLFAERTDLNRQLKGTQAQLGQAITYQDAPEKEVSVAELATRLEEADARHSAVQKAVREFERVRDQWKATRDQVWAMEKRIATLNEEIAKCRHEITLAQNAGDELKPAALAAKDAAEAAIKEMEDHEKRDEIKAAMAEVDATNKKVRANQAVATLRAQEEAQRLEAARLTDQIEHMDQQRAEMVATAAYPVPGLGFDADGNITFNGEPLAQASTAEQLRVSVAIGAALNPALRVLLVRNGNDLDSNGIKLLGELAETSGCQVWLERVAESKDGVTVLIEDGQVSAMTAPEVMPAEQAQRGVTLRNTSAQHEGFVDVDGKRYCLRPGEVFVVMEGQTWAASNYIVQEGA